MFRISHIIGVHREADRRSLDEIRELFNSAFPDYADDPDYIPRKLNEQAARGIPAILLAAHGDADRVIGFALADYFESIDYAYLDFCIAQVAAKLGKTADAARLMARAANYKTLFDAETGFIRGRNRDGSWVTPFDPIEWSRPYVEGSAWQCGWAVPHDPAGLIDLLGGRQSARSLHFIATAALVAFVIVHLAMVLLAGPFNEVRSMITGRYRLPLDRGAGA